MSTKRQSGGKGRQRGESKVHEIENRPRPQSHETPGNIRPEPSGESRHRPNVEREEEYEPAATPSGGAYDEERDRDRG